MSDLLKDINAGRQTLKPSKALVSRHPISCQNQDCCQDRDYISFCLLCYSFEQQESASTTEARLRMEGMEFKEEWQDEDFPR